MSKKQTKVYLDESLKREVQVKCIKTGKTMVQVITDLLREWLK